MFSFGPIEVLIVAILIAGVPGVVWSWIDSSKGVFKPFKRSFQIATVLSVLLVTVFLVFSGAVAFVAFVAGPLIVFVVSTLASLLGYALGPASSKRGKLPSPPVRESTKAAVETGNPYQPPEL